MKKVNVRAQEFYRATGAPRGDSRVELIDVETNRLFRGCSSVLDIKSAYERFWNGVDPASEGVVFVQEISIVE